MPRSSFQTLQDFIDRGCDLRLWCRACQHIATMDIERAIALFEDKGWALTLDANRSRFRCRSCRSVDILVLPTRRPKSALDGRVWDGASPIVWAFHNMRRLSKRPVEGSDRCTRAMIDRIAREAARKTYDYALAGQLRERRRAEAFPALRLVRVNLRLCRAKP